MFPINHFKICKVNGTFVFCHIVNGGKSFCDFLPSKMGAYILRNEFGLRENKLFPMTGVSTESLEAASFFVRITYPRYLVNTKTIIP